MKAYYISNITGNKCTVTTPSEFYTETLSIEDLQEFSKTNIVLGYNKLTESVIRNKAMGSTNGNKSRGVNNPVQKIRLYPEGTYKHKN